jgi:MFS transporter, SP family, galactose:H+ symporter
MAYVASFAGQPRADLLAAQRRDLPAKRAQQGGRRGHDGQWTFNFIISLAFLLLIEALGRSGAFWFYGVIGLLTLAFCWKFVPETKGKRLEDIQDYFQAQVDARRARA